ncbi:hypothetical protein VP01_18g10 [Puccinia sorghi]|uniref:Uncharacterized protein n=1 Tax=Puccinia sorghi TaxID=27349 RepID=A0A0L6VD01_9BASI|nr:hypothetical protein VP01_18g10 [Puccinia sorghi]
MQVDQVIDGTAAKRLEIAKVASPYYRNRTEALWAPDPDYFTNKPSSGTLVLCIRAIGPTAKDTIDGVESLLSALNHINIEPDLIQPIGEVDWPNHWLVHVSMTQRDLLPKYKGDSEGIFWNPKGPLKLFIWCLKPASLEEFNTMYPSCEIRWEITFPAQGPMRDNILKKIEKTGITFNTQEVHDPLKVTKAVMSGTKIGGQAIKNGTVVAYTTFLPCLELTVKYLTTKHWTVLRGFVGRTQVSLQLVDCCPTCGAEYHDSYCPYDKKVKDLLSQMSSIRKNGPGKNDSSSALLILDKPIEKRHTKTKSSDQPVKKQKTNTNKKPSKKKADVK